jgi:hypothetical protein
MRTVNTLSQVPLNALRADAQADGTWLVYEPGDTLPAAPPAGPEPRTISVQEFRGRFTDAELAGIVSSADVSVKVLLVKLQTRIDVDLNDPQIAAGLDLLVSKSLLTAPRRSVIGA